MFSLKCSSVKLWSDFYDILEIKHIKKNQTKLWYFQSTLQRCSLLLPVKLESFITKQLKPIFHRKLGSRWVPNANEIYTQKKKYTWPTPAFCVGTQRNLYSTDWRRGLASGLTQILGLASGVWRRETQISTF